MHRVKSCRVRLCQHHIILENRASKEPNTKRSLGIVREIKMSKSAQRASCYTLHVQCIYCNWWPSKLTAVSIFFQTCIRENIELIQLGGRVTYLQENDLPFTRSELLRILLTSSMFNLQSSQVNSLAIIFLSGSQASTSAQILKYLL